MIKEAVVAVAVLVPCGAYAQGARHWPAQQIADLEKKIAGNVDPARHLGLERFLDGATLIYRDGPSEAEVHQKLADFARSDVRKTSCWCERASGIV